MSLTWLSPLLTPDVTVVPLSQLGSQHLCITVNQTSDFICISLVSPSILPLVQDLTLETVLHFLITSSSGSSGLRQLLGLRS